MRYFLILMSTFFLFNLNFFPSSVLVKLKFWSWYFFPFFKKFYKICNMLTCNIVDYLFILPYILILYFMTNSYFKYTDISFLTKNISTDKLKGNNNLIKKNYNFILFRYYLFLFLILLLSNNIYRGYSVVFWNQHLFINEFIIYILNIIILFAILTLFILNNLSFNKFFFSIDFIYATSLIFLILGLIFLSNTFFTFYFILELTVCLIFFKFTVSRFFFRNPLNIYNANTLEKFSNVLPKNHVNVLFFQYWISFFSSVLLIFFFINLEFYFGSTEWTFLNLSIFFTKLPRVFYFYFFIFILSFFLKVGLTPFHLYKIEVYKGLPFITIFIYTILFFAVYFLFFSILFLKNFNMFFAYYWLSLLILLILGILYIIFLLFDINFIKSFFAYSTVVNLVSFTCIILANF